MALHLRAVLRILGLIVLVETLFLCVPLIVSLMGVDGHTTAFAAALCIGATTGGALWYANRDQQTIRRRDIYLIVVFAWLFVSLIGAMPYVLSGTMPSYIDAFFETVSGFTTTGATVITDIEAMPSSMLLWRSLTQWIGGMGIVVLMIAIMPLLGVGGMQLFNAESPGVLIDRLKPRVKETALIMWIVYSSLTVAAFLLFLMGGMSVFDATAHAFTTLASGGFSTKQASIGAFSPYIQYVVILFMFLTATNYALLFAGLTGRLRTFWRNDEFRAYCAILTAATSLVVAYLVAQGDGIEHAIRTGMFQVVSIGTATGFVTTNYDAWAGPMVFLLLALMFVGGMSGSTTGSIKVVRYVLLLKGAALELRKQLRPDAIMPLRFNGLRLPENVLHRVSSFFVLFILIYAGSVFVLMLMGVDSRTAVGAAAATMGNVGPGIGGVSPAGDYSSFSDGVKCFLSFLMVLGRLELFTFLILLTPYFWRRY